MRIPDADWREIKAAFDRVESYSRLGHLLDVTEKTARAWVEDRSREVRSEVKFQRSMRLLRQIATVRNIKTDTDSVVKGAGFPSKEVVAGQRVSHPDAQGGDHPFQEGATRMTLTGDQYVVIREWNMLGGKAAVRKLKQILRDEQRARRHLQQRGTARR